MHKKRAKLPGSSLCWVAYVLAKDGGISMMMAPASDNFVPFFIIKLLKCPFRRHYLSYVCGGVKCCDVRRGVKFHAVLFAVCRVV